jgi:hypothetical protein
VVQQDCSPVWRLQRFVGRLPRLDGQWLRAEVFDYNRVSRWARACEPVACEPV